MLSSLPRAALVPLALALCFLAGTFPRSKRMTMLSFLSYHNAGHACTSYCRWCGVCPSVHHHQPLQDDHLAGGFPRRQLRRRRVRAPSWSVGGVHGAGGVVGAHLGSDGLQLRRGRERVVRDGRVRHVAQVRGGVGRDAGEPGGVHGRGDGLLRREPGGRLQPAPVGEAGERAGQLQRGRLRRRPARKLPGGAGGEGGGRAHGGVPERVRRVRHGPVLLPGAVREPVHVPAHRLLEEVQGRMPHRLQLRLRRPHQHLHLLQRRLHRHLLLQQQVRCYPA
jgi:hypothetical protein